MFKEPTYSPDAKTPLIEFVESSFPLSPEEIDHLNITFREMREKKRIFSGEEIVPDVEYAGHLGSGKDGHQIKVKIGDIVYAVKFYHSRIEEQELRIIEELISTPVKGLPPIYALKKDLLVTGFIPGRYPYDRKDGKKIDALKHDLQMHGLTIMDDNYKNFILSYEDAHYVDLQGLRKAA
jgi:hypothetical protein